MAKTKIICTLGPASSSETIIRKMVLLGMDVVRLNFSHASHIECKARINTVLKINKKYHRHIRILGDLEGNRVRIGRLEAKRPIQLIKRKTIWLTQDDVMGRNNIISFDYRGSLKAIKKDQFIYIDDGRIALKVRGVEKKRLKAEVVVGGLLEQRKGVNIPQARLEFPSITEKDKMDINFVISQKLDYVAQSFVRASKDVLKLRRLIKPRLPECKIISKIENPEGIKNIDEIIDVSDGIMIARGDMGISVPIYEIPIIQKRIIRKCNKKKKFVITATQMLEHMVQYRIPTRAEVTDIANAILDGTDFVMLSAETAKGKYPVEATKIMSQIINFTEKSALLKSIH
ncbi:MAG: pyruvate kinase [Candidatus Omnitrophota bacterium]